MAMRHDQAAICLRVNKLWVEVLQAAFRKANSKNMCGSSCKTECHTQGGGFYGAQACSTRDLRGSGV